MTQAIVGRRWIAAGAAICGLATAIVLATRVAAPEWTPVVAGGLLLAAGFAVMAPCELQMAATLAVVLRNLAQDHRQLPVRRAVMRFTGGYVGFYLPVAGILGGLAVATPDAAGVLTALGGVGSLALGLAALGAWRPGILSRCRGPLWLVRTGRASFQRPLAAGFAFGQYCVTCCGPYLFALLVLAGATGSFALGGALVLGYAVMMAVPFLVPAVLAPATYSRMTVSVQGRVGEIERATGTALVGVGAMLVPLGLVGV